MRLAVCIKQVPESLAKNLSPDGRLRRDGQSAVLNPADVFALETALWLKERHGGTVDAFTMGAASAERVLREAAAMGADDMFLLSDRAFAGADTYATALALSSALKTGAYDIILCGRRTMDGETGQVPVQLAEMLGIPAVTNVVGIEVKDETIVCRRLLEDCEERRECKMPAVLSVMEGIEGIAHPRLPSLQGLRNAARKEVVRLDRESLGLPEEAVGGKGSFTEVGRVFFPNWDRGCRFLGAEEGVRETAEAIRRIAAERRGQHGR